MTALTGLLAVFRRGASRIPHATHSPIIMAYPQALIYWFSEAGIRPVAYEETEHYKVTKAFLSRREKMLADLLSE